MMKAIILIILSLIVIVVSGQDTIVELSQVQISASRLNMFTTGLKIITLDSLTLETRKFDNLDEIIARETPLYIKSYGQGSLATIAFRGTASTHTGIYWNGIQLNPPNIRQFDLSLAPGAYFNSVQILSGGSGSLFGSGNIGGSIHLNNEPVFNEGWGASAHLTAGSFYDYGTYAKVSVSGKRLYSSTALLYKTSENDFPYPNLKGEEVRQQNSAYRHYGLMQDLYWQFHTNWLAGASVWMQSTFREIPATMVSKPSVASQEDQSVKSILYLKNFHPKGYSSLKLAFFHDDLHYLDPASLIASDRDSKILTDKVIAEIQDNRQLFSNTTLNTGISLSYEAGESNNYDGFVSQGQVGFFASVQHYFSALQWRINLNLMQDLMEGYAVPFTPALGLEGKIYKFLYGKANFSRNFRIPSFNELYWKPYGNLNLEPEKSWNEEAGIIIKIGKPAGKHSSEFTTTIYNSNVTNWIVWIPAGSDWQPENIREVWSRGFEFSGTTSVQLNRFNIKISEGYTYARSTNENKVYSNDNSFKKQLIYVPVHRMFMNLFISYRGYRLNYNLTITGQRFTTTDNNQFLPGYSFHNLTAGKEFRIKKSAVSLQFDINNLLNENYQAIEYYPMPGRSYKVSINFKFNSL
jgi:iron complex outermembrane receptor protein